MIDETLKPQFKTKEQKFADNPVSQEQLEAKLERIQKENQHLKQQLTMFNAFKVIAEHTSTSVVIVNKDGIAEWVNNSFERLSGFQYEDVVGHSPGQFLMGEKTDLTTLQNVLNMMQLEQSFIYEVQHYNSHQEPYQLIVNGEPIFDSNGQLQGYAMLETDVTLLKVMEKSLMKAYQTEKENEAAKANFLANLSHEFRTPLNGIIGISQLLASTSLSYEQAEYIRTVQESGEALLTLIGKLLSLTEVTTDDAEYEQAEIRSKLAKGLEKFRPESDAKNIQLSLEIEDAVPQALSLNWGKVCEALMHLCDNAVKFTESGKIDIIVSHQGTNTLKFVVQDTGIGIRNEVLPHIFNEFYQADSSHTRNYQGAGLGLAIAKKMVESLNSQIEVDSIEGEGSRFFFVVSYTS